LIAKGIVLVIAIETAVLVFSEEKNLPTFGYELGETKPSLEAI